MANVRPSTPEPNLVVVPNNGGVVQPINKPLPDKPLPKWVKTTDVSLVIEKADLTFNEWSDVMSQLFKRDKSRQWEIGDGLVIGEAHFGEDCYQVVEDETEKEEEGSETYRQYMQVADRIPFGSRLPKLSWGHHQAVAYLKPERRDYWLKRALDEGLKRYDLRRAARREKRAEERKVKKTTRKQELELIHSEEAQAYFDTYLDALKMLEENIPKGLPSARMMNHAQQGTVRWQRNRTIDADCAAIVEMFAGKQGTAGVYCANDSDISVWLNRNNYFLSDYDLDDRLGLMVDKKMLDIVDREEGRQEGRKGGMDTVYQINPDYMSKLEDEDFAEEVD